MKKKQFRLSLFSTSFEVVNSLIISAAAHNGGMAETNLENLKTIGEGLIKQFNVQQEITFERVGETKLCIDGKIWGEWTPIAEIEMIEVFELAPADDLDGIF